MTSLLHRSLGGSMEQQFRQLVDEFCDLTGLDEPDAIMEGKSFNVDNVECAVIYHDHITPEAIYCYIDFGLPPVNQLNEVYNELLKANYLQFASIKATFSLSPHTGHVVLVTVIQLIKATAKMLVDQFSHHAQQALAWRDHFFLFDSLPSEASLPYNDRNPFS
jgi:hypothetical protein